MAPECQSNFRAQTFSRNCKNLLALLSKAWSVSSWIDEALWVYLLLLSTSISVAQDGRPRNGACDFLKSGAEDQGDLTLSVLVFSVCCDYFVQD